MGFPTPFLDAAIAIEAERSLAEREASFKVIAAWSLAQSLSNVFAASPCEIYESLTHIPDNLLVLLESPEGWRALASYVALDLGLHDLRFMPTIH
ncbi:MAG: hypothetical protein CL801_08380 [Citromicrobium sp.]|nr:hypothetical protein [Citromicrobium sp.]|tara:strand:- start:374 stop:658 length:285 start_codon:yes stop_codon:yes gene_type:complete